MEKPMAHTHNADPAAGPVCSHLVTSAHFEAWGIVIERTDKIVGCKHIVRHGMQPHEASTEAWMRGLIRVCTVEPQVTPNWTPDPARVAEGAAWAAANLRAEDRARRAA